MWNRRYWVDHGALSNAKLNTMLIESGFTVLSRMEHHFDPVGYTCIYLLAESHFALHTFPESGRDYLELTSCNRKMLLSFDGCIKKAGLENGFSVKKVTPFPGINPLKRNRVRYLKWLPGF